MASAVIRGSGVCSRREKEEAQMARRRAAREGGKARRLRSGGGAHLGFAAGLRAQPMWGAVELLGHHTQELCLVLTAIVVGGADVHQLEGRGVRRK